MLRHGAQRQISLTTSNTQGMLERQICDIKIEAGIRRATVLLVHCHLTVLYHRAQTTIADQALF
jgi:hypothetical protein